jgi:uncharacterized membrane protein (DUF2068 family)
VRARPLTVTVAIVLLALLSLSNLLAPVISEGIPRAAVSLLIVVGALGLVSALGLWMLKGWALWASIIICVLNILMNAPEISSPPAAISIVGFALVILLVVLPNSRRAYS